MKSSHRISCARRCRSAGISPLSRYFPRSVKQKNGETVVFSYIVYKSRADRDRINAKVMKDKRLAKMMELKGLPFDAKRMIWGGFKTLIAL